MPSLNHLLPWMVLLARGVGPEFARAEQPALTYFRSDHGLQTGTGSLPSNLEAPDSLAWRVNLDPGHSTPILCDGKIFLSTYRPDSKELGVVALEEKTGKEIWQVRVKPKTVEQTHPIGNPATATAACDGERVFFFFGSAGLYSYSLEGRELWHQSMGPFRDEYGAGSSPMLAGNGVVINQDHDTDSFVAAYDRATGKRLWKTPRPDAVRSYSTPSIWNQDGKAELLVPGALRLTAYDPDDGKPLWWINGLARIVIPTAVSDGPVVYMASWAPGGDSGKRISLLPWDAALAKWDSNHDGKLAREEIDDHEVLDRFYRMDLDQDGALDQKEWERHAEIFHRAQNAILAIKPSGTGELDESHVVWKHAHGAPYVSTPVLYRGVIWMVKEGGLVTKLDSQNGALLQEERIPGFGNYFASPVAGDGKVYLASEAGTVSIVSGAREWQFITSRDFHEKIYATPCLRGNKLFVRTERALYCFRGPPSP